MVTENRQNRDHFRDSNTPPRVKFLKFLFWLTCSAGSALDLFMFSLGTLCLWTSELGLKSGYIDRIWLYQHIYDFNTKQVTLQNCS